MAWRMLLRRCPTRSFTIVGDVAQVASPAGTRWWPETMDPLFGESWTMRELTISYRIPAAVAEAAQAFATAARLSVSELRAARELDDALDITRVQSADALLGAAARLASQHAAEMSDGEGGLVAVIVPDPMASEAREAVAAAETEGTTVEVHTARETKGLEFDVAVVVEPAAIAVRPGDLYVALTRPTRRLEIVHAEELPAGLG